jgi:hypothetical protein
VAPLLPRPKPLPNPLLAEITSTNRKNRFAACVAISSGAWGHGFDSCRSDEERTEWLNQLIDYLELARNAWISAAVCHQNRLKEVASEWAAVDQAPAMTQLAGPSSS